MSGLAEIAKDARRLASEETREFVCVHCKRAFKRESTLASHMCEPKRRVQRRRDPVVVAAFAAFQQFYASIHLSKNAQTHEQFESSSFYKGFIKFGIFITQRCVVAPERYVAYVIKNNIKLDHWCKETHYAKFITELIRTESADDAIARTVKYIDMWAEENKQPFNNYFKSAGCGKIALDISLGRCSPWMLYSCSQGIAVLDQLNPEQLALIYDLVDPDFWSRKLASWPDKFKFAQEVTDAMGFNCA